MTHTGKQPPRFSFSLRSLFVVVTVAALLSGIFRIFPFAMSLIAVELAALALVFAMLFVQLALTRLVQYVANRFSKSRADNPRQPVKRHEATRS